jgi:glycerol-3-phosphate cytidylyltransferase
MSKKTVITYGTFDVLHQGHLNLLQKAKNLGDYLIVGVTSSAYDKNRDKLNVSQSLHKRIKNIEQTGLVDMIIVEEYVGQKIIDIKKYNVDLFVIGSDWLNKFDYLKEYCEVKYLPRTKNISSTQIRNSESLIKIGIVGAGRIASRFVEEVRYVSNAELVAVCGRSISKANAFAEKYDIDKSFSVFKDMCQLVDAVYIATPHDTHYYHAKESLLLGKHVLCEKPLLCSSVQLEELRNLAVSKNLIFLEAIKTAFCDGFNKLVAFAKSGLIGNIVQLEASFTKLIKSDCNLREYQLPHGGSHNELMSYPLLAATKLMGDEIKSFRNVRYYNDCKVDIFSQLELEYEKNFAILAVGIGAKKEGHLIITGTDGYIYCAAPWWKTKEFEIRYEDTNKNEKFTYKFAGDGLRYEISNFVSCIINSKDSEYLSYKDMYFINNLIMIPDTKIIKKYI